MVAGRQDLQKKSATLRLCVDSRSSIPLPPILWHLLLYQPRPRRLLLDVGLIFDSNMELCKSLFHASYIDERTFITSAL